VAREPDPSLRIYWPETRPLRPRELSKLDSEDASPRRSLVDASSGVHCVGALGTIAAAPFTDVGCESWTEGAAARGSPPIGAGTVHVPLRHASRLQVPGTAGAELEARTTGRPLCRYSWTLIPIPQRSPPTSRVRLFTETVRGEGSRTERTSLFIDATYDLDTFIFPVRGAGSKLADLGGRRSG
jgi:hypothetical protein